MRGQLHGRAPRQRHNLHAAEKANGRLGISFNVALDENGRDHIPAAIAGSTLTFGAPGSAVAEVRDWSGAEPDLRFTPEGPP